MVQQCNQAGPGLGRTVPHSDLVVDKAPRNTITGKLQSIAVILHIQVPVLWICCLGLFFITVTHSLWTLTGGKANYIEGTSGFYFIYFCILFIGYEKQLFLPPGSYFGFCTLVDLFTQVPSGSFVREPCNLNFFF